MILTARETRGIDLNRIDSFGEITGQNPADVQFTLARD
jgi:hypothetical protein